MEREKRQERLLHWWIISDRWKRRNNSKKSIWIESSERWLNRGTLDCSVKRLRINIDFEWHTLWMNYFSFEKHQKERILAICRELHSGGLNGISTLYLISVQAEDRENSQRVEYAKSNDCFPAEYVNCQVRSADVVKITVIIRRAW